MFSWSGRVVGMVTDVRVVFCSGPAGCSLVRMFRMVWWSGKLGWLVQFIWLISLIVSVVLVKWLECWHQVVRMINWLKWRLYLEV